MLPAGPPTAVSPPAAAPRQLRPNPVPPRPLSPREAAIELGIGRTKLIADLNAAPKNGRGEITSGPWMGAYRRRSYYKIPPYVVERLRGRPEREALEARLARVEAELAHVKAAIGASFHALYPEQTLTGETR